MMDRFNDLCDRAIEAICIYFIERPEIMALAIFAIEYFQG